MPATLSDAQRKLLDDKNFAHVATIGEEGEPQVTPVWVEYDGTHVLFNTEEKRAKVKHMRKNPRIALSVLNSANPYQYIEIQGSVVDITTDGADEMIDRLAMKYMGKDKYPFNKPGDVRVVVKILPEKVLGMGF
ncbi:MAG TPA: PPOX class F420-dependent oxidoreductase [Polyangiaceae bacterium]|jgi:PPOX class probable F420-dependent enzyme|nr:PPOX class F420-dependent oxidoreductase [Polyangiaceae bacterium]